VKYNTLFVTVILYNTNCCSIQSAYLNEHDSVISFTHTDYPIIIRLLRKSS